MAIDPIDSHFLHTVSTNLKGNFLEDKIVRQLAEIKSYFGKRASELEKEASMLRSFLEIVDRILAEKSFKKIEISKETRPTRETSVDKDGTSIKAEDGTLLADISISDGNLKIAPNPDIEFDTNSPPFSSFLVNRILEQMRKKDIELAKKGEINVDDIFAYNIDQSNNHLKEIVVDNYGDERRFFELKNAVRWTFRRMYEKSATPSNRS